MDITMRDQEFVNFWLMVKFHGVYPSFCPQTSPDHVVSSWLHKGIFFVFLGGILTM